MGKHIPPILGQVFHYYTILDVVPKIKKFNSGVRHFKYKCLCRCGKINYVNINELKSGHSKSCGCYRIEKRTLPPGERGFRELYQAYKHSAKKGQREFDLSPEKFKLLTQSNCYYCGDPPTLQKYGIHKSVKIESTKYLYNGIDRLDNEKGYTEDNCVSACSMCNIAKKDYTKQEFLSWIEKVFKFNKGIINV